MKNLLLCCLLVIAMMGCRSIPKETNQATRRIEMGPGPEDIVLDDFGSQPRLLVSSMDRRTAEPETQGGIWSYDLATGETKLLPRMEEPPGIIFRPHGISLQQVDNKLWLWIISHGPEPGQHFVHTYAVFPDQLVYLQTYTSPLFRSPNEVYAMPDGSFYLSNDSYTGKNKELLLGQKKCEIIRVSREGEAEVVVEKVGMGNGVYEENGFLYVAATRENKVFRYRIEAETPWKAETTVKCPGPDNLTPSELGLLTVGHAKPLAFVRHAKKPSNISPTIVYRLDLETGTSEPLFVDKGDQISAGSTVVVWKDKMYISQVFEGWLLEVKMDQ